MKSIEKPHILNLVIRAVKEIGHETKNNRLIKAELKTELYGVNGNLDSFLLVRLIVDVEERVSSEIGKEIVIADERAMSLKSSPFRNIESLTEHTFNLLNKEDE